MFTREFVIVDPNGFHAVPVSRLARLAKESAFEIFAHDLISGPVLATSHLRLLALGLHRGETLKVSIATDDEQAAIALFEAIGQLLEPTPTLH
jgi:phosphotransferase system HPr (HPr) family protein